MRTEWGIALPRPKVLIGSPIRQEPAILGEFLTSLHDQWTDPFNADYLFVDDNVDPESSRMIRQFRLPHSQTKIASTEDAIATPAQGQDSTYLRTEESHLWREESIWRVARFKDFILQAALQGGYDYAFLVDSDLILNPVTIAHLISTGKEIVAEVYWTKWRPDLIELPQVWVADQYCLHRRRRDESLTEAEALRRTSQFLDQLRQPGTYRVGGLGACTLISRSALLRGVSFQEIPNVSFWGEDRHFCIRAAALGIDLWADTHFPAYHVYRRSDLAGIPLYRAAARRMAEKYIARFKGTGDSEEGAPVPGPAAGTDSYVRKPHGNKLTLAMIVRNEAGGVLPTALRQLSRCIDEAVIVDDASSDGTPEVCQELLQGIPVTLVHNPGSMFSTEYKLRMLTWDLVLTTDPDWILFLDADELFEEAFVTQVRSLIDQTSYDWVGFRLYDMWDETHYRSDHLWTAHERFWPLLMRYLPGYPYRWNQTNQHCGRLPANVTDLPGLRSNIRVKHYGWADPERRLAKYRRYLRLDPEGRFGSMEQYRSILDPNPNLVPWQD